MKRLLTLLFFALLAITTQAQTVPNLPAGSTPFGTGLFRDPDGDIWGGSKFDGYVNLGNWQRVADSLGVKINWSDTTIIASKEWVEGKLNSLPPSGVLSVTGDGVDNTDPANPVLSYPDPSDIGALAPGDDVSELTNDAGYLTTETDPVYSGDPASSITQNDIDAWNDKQDAITGAATTVVSSNLTPSRALISNSNGKIAVSPVSAAELAFIDGVTSNVQDQLDAKIPLSQKGASNGVAPIGNDGKIPGEYLPSSGSYKGTWDASTNTPTIADGVGTNGDRYRVAVGGTVDLGSGPITFVAGDDVIYNGTVWQRSPSGVTVTSVAGKTGDVILDKNDVGLGNVDNTSDLDKPISNAVQDALDLKLDASEISNYYTKTNLQTSGQAQVHWDNITNVPSGLGVQTLSLGSTAGQISISEGNSVNLASVDASGYSGAFEDFNPNVGLWPYRAFSGSSGYPGTSGGGIRFNRNLGNNSGSFDIFKAQGTSPKLYYSVGLNGPWGQYTFASEEWVSGNYVTLGTNQTITGLKTIVGGNALRIQAATDAAYISFLASDGSTRKGYIGFPTTSPNDIFINNDAGGLLKVKSGVNGLTYDYGSGDKTVWHEGNLDPGGFLKLSSASSQEVTGPVVFSGNPQVPLSPASANSAIAKGYLENTLTSYALDNSVVKLTGNQNILGDKTFEGTVWHYGNLILENEPISDKMAATKKYVDDAIINNGVQAGFGLTKDTATNTMSWGTVQTFGDETYVSVAVPSKTVLYFGDITDNTQPTLGILNSTGLDGLQGVSFFSGTVNNNLSSVHASSNADGTQTRARMASTDGVTHSTLELVPAKTTLTAEEFEVKTPSSGESAIILTAPNGSRYRVTVDNAGNLTTTLVP